MAFTPLSSVSTSQATQWDVFLSFRGIDTRYTFTDHLYHALHRTGIRTFKDDPELRSGEVISDSLVQAIQESKTFIVVLSENYASSSWCLDELVEILGCYNQFKKLVVPVFYNIDPSVVRHQIGSFHEAFEKHHARYDGEKVKTWRITLKEVAVFSGYHISQNRSQADIVDKVVDRILLETNPRTLDVAKYPVGLDSRVKSVTALMKRDPEGVTKIGIHGMGGVGKTTLAKAVYNQNYHQFQGSCFLANVREVSKTDKGLLCLQQLFVDVLKCNNINISNVDQAIELIRARICSKKVLIVIDDLDNQRPLEFLEGSFALGSVIIITTRNEDLLDSIKVQARYKVNELDEDESRRLFAQHAFGENKISDTITASSTEILQRAGGLPLALKVFGSNLFNKPEEEWRWFIDKLNRVPVDDIEKTIVISFDALQLVDPMLQDIFLDIACFYIGWKKEEVVKIMETCYTFVKRNIDILMKRCMLTINDRDELGMHDLLREMGRDIARNHSRDEPGEHSRLWISEDIYTVLKYCKGTKAIQGIIPGKFICHDPDAPEGVSLPAETFKMTNKLKFLFLSYVNLTGNFEHTFDELRWLHWKYCPLTCLPSEFHPQNLVILELPCSEMRTMWQLNMVTQIFGKLKTLNLSNSPNLITTPDFTTFPFLETLNLNWCKSLEEVHISIRSLVRLASLDLGDCSNLRKLPDSICSLRALEVLTITGCTSLEALPVELGNIESLKVLNASRLNIIKLPNSIGCLSKLVRLDIYNNKNLETLPNSICNLRSLEILHMNCCKKLEELPDNLGKITSLRDLNTSVATVLKMLPDISRLSNIGHLDLTDCRHLLSIAELPPNLVKIRAAGCTSLNRLPNLSNLKQLALLDLTNCRSLTDILGLEELTSLEVLKLTGCNSSLLAYTLTERFFQISSEFGHRIKICIRQTEFPDWISQSSIFGSAMSLELPPNASHNFLGMIFCFTLKKGLCKIDYSVKNITSDFIWSDTLSRTYGYESLMVIVPSSIFSIRNGDDLIELTSNREIALRIHLLYKTEITMIRKYESASLDEENERCYPSKRLKRSSEKN